MAWTARSVRQGICGPSSSGEDRKHPGIRGRGYPLSLPRAFNKSGRGASAESGNQGEDFSSYLLRGTSGRSSSRLEHQSRSGVCPFCFWLRLEDLFYGPSQGKTTSLWPEPLHGNRRDGYSSSPFRGGHPQVFCCEKSSIWRTLFRVGWNDSDLSESAVTVPVRAHSSWFWCDVPCCIWEWGGAWHLLETPEPCCGFPSKPPPFSGLKSLSK